MVKETYDCDGSVRLPDGFAMDFHGKLYRTETDLGSHIEIEATGYPYKISSDQARQRVEQPQGDSGTARATVRVYSSPLSTIALEVSVASSTVVPVVADKKTTLVMNAIGDPAECFMMM